MEIALSIIMGMGIVTFILSLCVHARRIDFYNYQEEYTRMAIRDGLMWPYTFVRVIRDYITRVK